MKKAESGSSSADVTAIRRVAVDYYEGWYEGDAKRMERCLHPDVAKRELALHPRTGRNMLGLLSHTMMVEMTRAGGGSDISEEKQHCEVTILDVWKEIASVKVKWPDFKDFLHVAKFNGQWIIVNVLWQRSESAR